MNYLLTGGAGFIGSNVANRLLREGNRVTIIDDFNAYYDPTLKRQNVARLEQQELLDVHEADISNQAAVEKVFAGKRFDAVIHLAARAGVRPSIEQPQLYVQANVVGTVNILEAVRKAGIKKLVFASTSSVYGTNSKLPFSESDPILKIISPYAATKLAGEALCHTYHHLHGLDAACLRFFTVYGPNQRPDLVIHKFCKLMTSGKPIEVYGDGSTRRDYTFVEDIVEGICSCLKKDIGYEIMNIGDSNTVQLRYLIELLERFLGKKAEIIHRPEQMGDMPVTFADISKAQRILGYQPKVKIEQGIERFVQWFRVNR